MHYSKRRQYKQAQTDPKQICQTSSSCNKQNRDVFITLCIASNGEVSIKQQQTNLQQQKPAPSQIPVWLKKTEVKPRQKTSQHVPRWLTLKPSKTAAIQTVAITPRAVNANKSKSKANPQATQAKLLTAPIVCKKKPVAIDKRTSVKTTAKKNVLQKAGVKINEYISRLLCKNK